MAVVTNTASLGRNLCFPSLTIYLSELSWYNLFSLNFNSLFCKVKLIASISLHWCQHEIIHLCNLIYIQYLRNIGGYYFLYPDLVDNLHGKQKCIMTITWSVYPFITKQDLALVRYYGTGLGWVSINLIEIVRSFPSCNAVFLFWTHLNHKVKDAVILLGPPKMMKWGYLLIPYLLQKHIIHKSSNTEVPTLLCLRVYITKYGKEYDISQGICCQSLRELMLILPFLVCTP